MSKKSKIVAIGSILIVFIILFIEAIIPIIIKDWSDHNFPKDFDLMWIFLILLPILAILLISIGSSFFIMEFFVEEKTVLSGRPMTGIFSLITVLFILIAHPLESGYLSNFESFYLLFSYIIIGISIVLISKAMCFFMIKKGFDMTSVFVFMISGAFVNYFILIGLILRDYEGKEVGWTMFFFGVIVTVISLFVNWKEILKMKRIKRRGK